MSSLKYIYFKIIPINYQLNLNTNYRPQAPIYEKKNLNRYFTKKQYHD